MAVEEVVVVLIKELRQVRVEQVAVELVELEALQ
jgi:hypothetical protein